MGLAMLRRDNQVKGFAECAFGGMSKRFFRAGAPKTDDAGSIGNHDGMMIQILLPALQGRVYSRAMAVRLPLPALF